MDRHELYECCVQSPVDVVRLLVDLHGRSPLVLREDFSGTAAVSRAWTALSGAHRAEAVDHDADLLARAVSAPRIERIHADVRSAEVREASCDVVFVGNYSIGEIGSRAELVDYLVGSRRRLRGGGVFVCDTYGGESAFRRGTLERRHVGPGGTILHHVWEQRGIDPLAARVENALHFRVEDDGCIVNELRDAFVYRWRLWSVPELVDALAEAGFAGTRVRTVLRAGGEPDPEALGRGFSACIAATLELDESMAEA